MRRSAFVASIGVIGLLAGFCLPVRDSLPPHYQNDPVSTLGNVTITAHNSLHDRSTITLRTRGRRGEKWQAAFPEFAFKQVLLARLNGKPCLLAIVQASRTEMRVYEVEAEGLREVWKGLGSVNPWKVQAGDVDGDGRDEIGVGVYKKAGFHPVMANRLFIYIWDGRDMQPKWLGSRLSRPFTDFAFLQGKLVAVEETREGMNELAVYRWDGFGFTGEWAGAKSPKLSGLMTDHSLISVQSGSRRMRFRFKGYQLQEVGS